jgi:hypothetical protein
MELEITPGDAIEQGEVVALYAANGWSSAQKPTELMAALRNSDFLVTARAATVAELWASAEKRMSDSSSSTGNR